MFAYRHRTHWCRGQKANTIAQPIDARAVEKGGSREHSHLDHCFINFALILSVWQGGEMLAFQSNFSSNFYHRNVANHHPYAVCPITATFSLALDVHLHVTLISSLQHIHSFTHSHSHPDCL